MSELLIKQVEAMNVKSDEFFELYKTVWDKYWSFDDPDSYQQSAKALSMFAERAPEDLVVLSSQILEEVLKMREGSTGTRMGTLSFKNGDEYFFQISKDKSELGKMTEVIKQVAEGNFKVKKTPFGKSFFKRKK